MNFFFFKKSRVAKMQFTNETIREAVKDWNSDSDWAVLKWGPMEEWDTSQVTDMKYLFYKAPFFTADLSRWDVSQVTNMSGVFADATDFNGDVSTWDVSRVTRMDFMFWRATSFTGDVSTWDVSRVKNMRWMFRDATLFSADLSRWDVGSHVLMDQMFTDSGIFHNWGLVTLRDIPNNHAYRKAYRIHSVEHLWLDWPRMQSICMYV